MKIVQNDYSKPFYLKPPKVGTKQMVFMGIIFLVLALSNPYLFIGTPIYIVYIVMKVKKFNKKTNKLLSDSINYYNSGDFESSFKVIQDLLEIEPDNVRVKIIHALLLYNKEELQQCIDILSTIPETIIKNDLDLQLKLAECYVKTEDFKEAKVIYSRLLKVFPRSPFIKDALQKISEQIKEK